MDALQMWVIIVVSVYIVPKAYQRLEVALFFFFWRLVRGSTIILPVCIYNKTFMDKTLLISFPGLFSEIHVMIFPIIKMKAAVNVHQI